MFFYKIILFLFYLTVSQCRVPDKVYCVNEDCSEPISKAKTLLRYNSGDPDLISFHGNADAIVYMKSAGTNPDLWYAKIGEQSGFVSTKFLREYKVYEKNPQFINPVEVRKKEPEIPHVMPDRVQQAHEVFEGTTIYSAQSKTPEPTSTTEIPSVETESATPEFNSNETNVPSLPKESQNDFNPSGTNNKIIEQNIDSEQIADDSKPIHSAPVSQIITQQNTDSTKQQNDAKQNTETTETQNDASSAETQTSESDSKVESEPNVDVKEINQVHPEIVPIKHIPESDNPGDYENIENVQNTTPQPEPSDSSDIKGSTPSSTVENIESNSQSEGQTVKTLSASSDVENIESNSQPADHTEKPIVPLDDNFLSQPQEESTQQPPSIQNDSLFGSFFNRDPQNQVPNEKESEVSDELIKVISETVTQETSNQSAEKLSNAKEGNVNLPNDPIQAEPVTDIEQFNKNSHSNIIPAETTEQSDESVVDEATTVGDKQPSEVPQTAPALVSENIPGTSLPDTIQAANIPQPEPPSSSETPFYQVPQTTPTKETLPPIFNSRSESTETESQESSIPGVYSYSFSTEPNKVEEPTTDNYFDSYSTTEVPPVEEIYIDSAPSNNDNTNGISMETPVQEDSSEGFISSMYSTLADIWRSSTEAPQSLFNTEAYPTFEEEKVDGKTGFSFMSYIMSTYYSVMGVNDDMKALFPSHGETCYSEEYCDGKGEQSHRFLTFLVTAASSVLLFTLGYYYIDNKRQDGKLIGQINSLQRDLLFSTKECEILKEELSTTKNKLAGIEDSSFGMDEMVQSLKEEINELLVTNNRLRHSLDDNEKLLRVSENTAGELQNTLGELENTLSELLNERANSEEQINELNGKIQAYEVELISVSRERDNYQLKYVSAETALEETKKYKKQLDDINQQLLEAKNTIELRKHEITALKDAIKELKGGVNADVDAASLIDHTAIKAKLSKALEEKNSLANKYEVEHTERKHLAEELQSTQEALRTASQQATEALTRLEVLGKYFQEREGELLKELSAKESLFLSKQGESVSTVEKIELLQQEVQRYKEKCDALTLELAEQESSRRTAVSEVESRAHAAWLEARGARREADAARDEAAALRRKLASLAAADAAPDAHRKVISPLDLSDSGVLPPPLPLAFLPPPLLPPLPRPPPLGRLPSPHPPRYGERRYSPDSRYSGESRYSPQPARYSPDSRYSPRSRHDAYSPRSRRRSRERYNEGRGSRTRNGPADTETEYNSDSPSREPRRRSKPTYSSSGSGGYSSGSDK